MYTPAAPQNRMTAPPARAPPPADIAPFLRTDPPHDSIRTTRSAADSPHSLPLAPVPALPTPKIAQSPNLRSARSGRPVPLSQAAPLSAPNFLPVAASPPRESETNLLSL